MFATCPEVVLSTVRFLPPLGRADALFLWLANFLLLCSGPQRGQKLRHQAFRDEQRLSVGLPSVVC